jgi:sortase A
MTIDFTTLAGKRKPLCLARHCILLFGTFMWTAALAQGHPFSYGDPVAPAEPESRAPEIKPLWLQNPWTGDTRLVRVPEPDQSLWNATRIDDYKAAVAEHGDPPLALFTISRLGVKVPVYNGTDEFNLDRGLGRIPGMARIHEDGHLGISGHRDGFFRVLKDIQSGDRIMLRSASRSEVFEVRDVSIVDKTDDRILHEKSDERRLTLVTCFPFYFMGNAPQRFIVHAVPVPSFSGVTQTAQQTPAPAVSGDAIPDDAIPTNVTFGDAQAATAIGVPVTPAGDMAPGR